MFYINSIKDSKYGVVDNHNIERFYTKEEVLNMVNLGTKIYGVKDESITVARDFIKLKYKLIGKCFSEPVDLTSNYAICCDAIVSINFWYFSLDSVDKKPTDSRYIDAELIETFLKEGVHINNILNRNSDFKHNL